MSDNQDWVSHLSIATSQLVEKDEIIHGNTEKLQRALEEVTHLREASQVKEDQMSSQLKLYERTIQQHQSVIDVTGDIQTLKADLLGLRRENDSLQQSAIIPTPCDVNWQQRAEGLDSQVQTLTRRLQEAS